MRSFVEFMNEQFRIELYKEHPNISAVDLTWFTTAVKLAIEASNPNSQWYSRLDPWRYEVIAMLTAYYRANYITATEFNAYRETFYHWMRCNNRARKPFTLIRER